MKLVLFNNNNIYKIDSSRVTMTNKINFELSDDQHSLKADVYIDGEYFMTAMIVYLVHEQYLTFEKNVNEEFIKQAFNNMESLIFLDLGFETEPNSKVFKDFTEKAREGINYFSDIITDTDKCEYFKNNYVKVEVIV